MASIHQIRGALLEEIVLLLLARSGYRRILVGEEGTRNGPAGLEVEGRGTHHQIDALVTPLHSHAFVYPIRLLVEAKCQGNPVRLTVIRSAVGTLFDINQNYFSGRLSDGREVQVQRFNYHAAVFASNGYSENAEKYASAHQVYLIDYSDVPAMRSVTSALLALDLEDFSARAQGRTPGNLTEIRNAFRDFLEEGAVPNDQAIFSGRGVRKAQNQLMPSIRQIRGSYYGMIEGLYPVHLISRREISMRLIREQYVIPCAIHFTEDEQTWAFEPTEVAENSDEFFRLEFSIPEFIADMLNARSRAGEEQRPRWLHIANVKQQYMKFIDVTTVNEGQLVNFRLVLDLDWLNRYIEGREAREARRGSAQRG